MPPLFDPAAYAPGLTSAPTLLTMVAILALGILTLARERISLVSVSFFVLTLAVTLWLFAQSWLYAAVDSHVALWWAKAAYLGVPFIAAATYQFTAVVLQHGGPPRWAVATGWAASALFSASAIGTDGLVAGLYHYSWGYYPHYGPLGVPFIAVFIGLLLAAMVHYVLAYRALPPGSRRTRVQALMIAFAIGYLGAVDLIPAYGIPLYPFGYLPILGFVGLAARAIYVHRLVDITPAFAAGAIIDTMTDALLVLDAQGVVRLVNPATIALFGGRREDLIGHPAAGVLPNSIFTDPTEFAGLLRQGHLENREIPYQGLATTARILCLSASVMSDERARPAAVVCIVRDITEQKRAEEEIRRQNTYLGALHETSLGLMHRLDIADLLETLIQRAATLVGTEHGYIYVADTDGTRLTVRAGIGVFASDVGNHLAAGEGLAGRVWQTGAPLAVHDYSGWEGRATRFADTVFHAVVGVPLRVNDHTAGVLGLAYLEEGRSFGGEEIDLLRRFAQLGAIALDNAHLYQAAQQELAERTRAEGEVKRLNEDLERRVVERTQQLEAAMKELEAFSYSVSHDLRAPLRAVTGFSNAALEDFGEQLDSRGQRYLHLIRDNATNMGRLIDDLLAFSRLGRQQMDSGMIDMRYMAQSVADELQEAAPVDSLDLQITALPPAHGDRAMIRQVFANLLSNARKFSKDRRPPRITVGGVVEDGENRYWVRDNGAGFDMRYAHKLFGVFQRLHSSNEFEGTGVGLALVHRIITRHGGRVWAEGAVGEGATFYFTLPRKGELP